MDLKVNGDEIYFLEINSRFTTPYVGVKKIANINIAKSIISTFSELKSIRGFDFRKRILLWLFYNYHYRMLNLYIKLSNKLQIILQRRGHNISQ